MGFAHEWVLGRDGRVTCWRRDVFGNMREEHGRYMSTAVKDCFRYHRCERVVEEFGECRPAVEPPRDNRFEQFEPPPRVSVRVVPRVREVQEVDETDLAVGLGIGLAALALGAAVKLSRK